VAENFGQKHRSILDGVRAAVFLLSIKHERLTAAGVLACVSLNVDAVDAVNADSASIAGETP
jgi:hypothetical protein